MNRRWRGRKSTPPPPGISKVPNVENRRPRSGSSRPKSRISSLRRSRSPRAKKSMSPGSKRRGGGGGGGGGGNLTPTRIPGRRERPLGKRPRINLRNRSKTPSRRLSRERSRERPPQYSPSKDHSRDRSTSKINSSSREDRFRSGDKYLVERPLFRGPEKDIMMDRDSLKKIVVNMRDIPAGNDSIKRDIINPEDITVVRRTVASGGNHSRDRMNEEEMNLWENFEYWNEYPRYYQIDSDGFRPCTSEGSRPIFDREEIKNYSRKFEEEEESRRAFSGSSPPPRSDRRPGSSPERFRNRDYYYNNERNSRNRESSSVRAQRDYDSSYDRPRDERSRYGRSSRSGRSRSRDRRDRYDDSRRNRTRGRSSDRSFRRRLSPGDSRRCSDDYRDRSRSMDREEMRHELPPPQGEYSSGNYVLEAHGYYEGEAIDGQIALAHRGGGRGLSLRGRGMPNRTLVRPGEIIMRLTPPVRPVRGSFIPRGPAIARRLPFPPRLIRPTGRPVIRVIAPVIPVRPPVLPVRPHPVIPVRHPVIPIPF